MGANGGSHEADSVKQNGDYDNVKLIIIIDGSAIVDDAEAAEAIVWQSSELELKPVLELSDTDVSGLTYQAHQVKMYCLTFQDYHH